MPFEFFVPFLSIGAKLIFFHYTLTMKNHAHAKQTERPAIFKKVWKNSSSYINIISYSYKRPAPGPGNP